MNCKQIKSLGYTRTSFLKVHLEAFKKGYNNRYYPFLVNVEFNFCDTIARKNFLAYGKLLFNIMKPFTNVNHTCPYTVKLI